MTKTLISLMCHPDNKPAIQMWTTADYDVLYNREPGYANAIRYAINFARQRSYDLVIADADGYHPVREIERIAKMPVDEVIKPQRYDIGIQSRVFSVMFSLKFGVDVADVSGGFIKISRGVLPFLPPLVAVDNRIWVEIMAWVVQNCSFFEPIYHTGRNDVEHSHRPGNYQWKLFRSLWGKYQ
jgi:hypothetical protein